MIKTPKLFSLLILFLLFFIMSCKEKNTDIPDDILRANKVWLGEKIFFSKSIKPLYYSNSNLSDENSSFTIVAYYDGNCSLCYFELSKWKEEIKIFKENDVKFKFILSSDNRTSLDINLESIQFPKKNVFHDKNKDFQNKYPFLLDLNYVNSSMLLDSTNTILYIGNPLLSNDVYEEYNRIIKN